MRAKEEEEEGRHLSAASSVFCSRPPSFLLSGNWTATSEAQSSMQLLLLPTGLCSSTKRKQVNFSSFLLPSSSSSTPFFISPEDRREKEIEPRSTGPKLLDLILLPFLFQVNTMRRNLCRGDDTFRAYLLRRLRDKTASILSFPLRVHCYLASTASITLFLLLLLTVLQPSFSPSRSRQRKRFIEGPWLVSPFSSSFFSYPISPLLLLSPLYFSVFSLLALGSFSSSSSPSPLFFPQMSCMPEFLRQREEGVGEEEEKEGFLVRGPFSCCLPRGCKCHLCIRNLQSAAGILRCFSLSLSHLDSHFSLLIFWLETLHSSFSYKIHACSLLSFHTHKDKTL